MNKTPTPEELSAWAYHPVTQYIVDAMREALKIEKDSIYVDYSNVDYTAQKAAYKSGVIDTAQDFIDNVEELKTKEGEEE